MNGYGAGRSEEEEKGLLWKLPEVRLKDLGKVGPGFGLGAGCDVGFGVGLIGGVGIGLGIPGLQFGFGVGAGCGVGYGFGYGVGRGVAHDDKRRYSNIGKYFQGPGNLPTRLAEDWLNTMQIVRLISQDHMNIKQYVGKADFLVLQKFVVQLFYFPLCI